MTDGTDYSVSLRLSSVYYKLGDNILSDISLDIARGEIVTLLGRSGRGKSTILKILAGLHKGYEGDVTIKDDPVVGYIPQNKCLLPWKTVYENLMLLKRISDLAKGTLQKEYPEADKMLARLSIAQHRDRYVKRLSGGEYQRVVLGQVFLLEPDLILMDEPFSALDNYTKQEILELFLSLRREKSISTVFVTHNLEEAKAMNGRVFEI